MTDGRVVVALERERSGDVLRLRPMAVSELEIRARALGPIHAGHLLIVVRAGALVADVVVCVTPGNVVRRRVKILDQKRRNRGESALRNRVAWKRTHGFHSRAISREDARRWIVDNRARSCKIAGEVGYKRNR